MLSLEFHLVPPVLWAAGLALGFALLLAPMMGWLCRMIGWVDAPDSRKLHEGAIPLSGGLVIAAAVLLAALAISPNLVLPGHYWIGAAMVFAVGFADDRFPIRARYRFAVQLCAAFTFIVLSGSMPTNMGRLLGPFEISLGAIALPFAIIGITGLTNAVNMMDGVDGLAGGLVLGALLWLLVALVFIAGDVSASSELVRRCGEATFVTALVAGALAAFLLFNQRTPWRARASMFLGDGGSMMLGFIVAALCIYASGAFGPYGMTPVTGAWIAAVPLADMFASMLRRILEGKTPMTPDRQHMHHLLLALGLTSGRAVLVLQAVGFATGLIGVVGWRLGVAEYWMFWGLVGCFSAYFVASQRAWRNLASRGV